MSSRLQPLFLILLLLCAPVFPVAEVNDAASYNLALAPSFLGAGNSCGFPGEQISHENMLSVARVRAIAIIPSVGNITSDAASPSVVWGYFAEFPEEAEFVVQASGSCPEGSYRLHSPGAAGFSDGILEYNYGDKKGGVALYQNGPNPAPISLSGATLRDADLASPLANLTVNVSGKIFVDYEYELEEYSEYCTSFGKYTGCGCEKESERGIRRYEKHAFDSRTFFVENGEVETFWLNPPLQKRLDGNGDAEVAVFSRRIPQEIEFLSEGKLIGRASVYKLEKYSGECGEMVVSRKFLPVSENLLVAEGGAISPSQLVQRNASYFQYYLESGWKEAPGRKNVTVAVMDAFSARHSKSTAFLVRSPLAFGNDEENKNGGAAAMEYRKGSDSVSPAAYPTDEKTGEFPALFALAALAAVPLLLGARAILSSAWQA